jgi:DNA-binding NarL/FixJ family response regulator
MKRIIIVEDDATLAANVEKILTKSGVYEVLGNYPSAEAALKADKWGEADVFLSDLGLPGMQGAELIRIVREKFPGLVCQVYSLYSDEKSVFEALRAGGQGYLLKGSTSDELLAALRSLLRGESPMSPSIAQKLLENFLKVSAEEEYDSLSVREVAIVRQLADGFVYKEVADQLGVSIHTVHSHIKRIYVKLQATSKGEAIRKAKGLGYL